MIVLETERLILREHRAEDFDAFFAMESDPEVRRFVGGAPRPQAEARRRFRGRFLRARRGRLGLWATALRSTGEYAGYSGVYPYYRAPGRLSAGEGCLGFTLARPFWRRGLATEAASALVRYGFDELGLDRILASVEAGNAASIHILEKLGFRLRRLERVGRRCLYHLELPRPQK
ncbi:MAG TPA: GNAT family N-acetyltransferase [Thermoanaerobaculia bacterium]|nr:GNAT family N-acetyltransferase [Thermoanaerobaculia bacterium]